MMHIPSDSQLQRRPGCCYYLHTSSSWCWPSSWARWWVACCWASGDQSSSWGCCSSDSSCRGTVWWSLGHYYTPYPHQAPLVSGGYRSLEYSSIIIISHTDRLPLAGPAVTGLSVGGPADLGWCDHQWLWLLQAVSDLLVSSWLLYREWHTPGQAAGSSSLSGFYLLQLKSVPDFLRPAQVSLHHIRAPIAYLVLICYLFWEIRFVKLIYLAQMVF